MALLEYDLYLPIYDNDGESYNTQVFNRIKSKLVDYFGGITDFRHKTDGAWKMGKVTFNDEILLYRILSNRGEEGRAFLTRLKQSLEVELGQDQILIIERSVTSL
jgi:hypothetical protein